MICAERSVMLDLTAFILTQNNIRTIAACLDSLSWCENVVVIDSFSTDGTLEVISRYPNVRLYQHDYTNAREQRIWGMPHVLTKWVFIIDSDEICPPLLRDKLVEIVNSGDGTYDGYLFLTRTLFMGKLLKHRDYLSSRGKRLVMTGVATRYWRPAKVHASIRLDNKKYMPNCYYLIHDPIDSLSAHFKKMLRYARWQAEDMYDSGVRTKFWHLTLRPVGKFLQYFIIRGAFRDGWRGLVICVMGAIQVALKYLLLAELAHKRKAGGD